MKFMMVTLMPVDIDSMESHSSIPFINWNNQNLMQSVYCMIAKQNQKMEAVICEYSI